MLTIIKKANAVLGFISRNFRFNLSVDAFICLRKTMIRSQLECVVQVWSQFGQSLTNKIETFQKRATRLITACCHLSYKERLKFLKLPSLEDRRKRADLIKMYNMTHRFVSDAACPAIMFSPD